MKMISEMTNDELDEHIARLRGWKQTHGIDKFGEYYAWLNPRGHIAKLPSPTTDPRYAMELLEEMLVGGGHYLRYIPERKAFGVGRIENENAYRTISIAYAQWKGEK